MEINTLKNNKFVRLFIIVFVIILVFIVTYSIYQMSYRAGKIQIVINTVPTDAKITLNDDEYKNGENYIVAGEYKIIVQKDGFKTIEISQDIIKPGDEVDIALEAESDSAKDWASKNPQAYSNFANIVDKKTNKDGAAFRTLNPIVNKLPYTNYLFSIGYKLDSSDKTDNSIIITINASEQYRQAAILQVKQWGYNLADYNYEFINFDNPFKI